MNAVENNIATARGEALAANLLASAAIRTVIAIVANKEEILSSITAYVDDTLNMSGPGKGDPNDEFNTHMREIARVHAMQSVDAIRRLLK